MNVKADTIAVAAHFFLKLQLRGTSCQRALPLQAKLAHFLGFSGSSGPSQSIINTSLYDSASDRESERSLGAPGCATFLGGASVALVSASPRRVTVSEAIPDSCLKAGACA